MSLGGTSGDLPSNPHIIDHPRMRSGASFRGTVSAITMMHGKARQKLGKFRLSFGGSDDFEQTQYDWGAKADKNSTFAEANISWSPMGKHRPSTRALRSPKHLRSAVRSRTTRSMGVMRFSVLFQHIETTKPYPAIGNESMGHLKGIKGST